MTIENINVTFLIHACVFPNAISKKAIIFLALQMCICFASTYVCLPTRTCQRIFTQHFTKLEISDHQYQQHFVPYSNADLGDKSPLSELIFILDDVHSQMSSQVNHHWNCS